MQGGMYSHQGGREYNEDSCTALKIGNVICAIMADGLGGHGGGDVASKETVAIIKRNFRQCEDIENITKEHFDTWFSEANEYILKMQNADCQMRTTLAVLCINEKTRTANWAHLGDSRIYHFVNGKVVFYTFDHSVSRMAVLAGEIEVQDVRFHKDRSKLLKAIGKENVGSPECGETRLDKDSDHAFLLCTDGFWEYVTEDVMEQTLAESADPDEWLRAMYSHLNTYVRDRNICNDNNSAIAIFI